MTVLETQLNELLEHSISVHGYWLKNHADLIGDTLRSGIVSYGLSNMKQRIDDWQSPYMKNIYNIIDSNK